jgi:hypothetical protein
MADPEGRVIWRQGIEPDVAVGLEPQARIISPTSANTVTVDELTEFGDEQLWQGMRILQEAVASGNE